MIVGLGGSSDSGTHLSAAAKGDQALLFLRRASLQAQRKSIDVVRLISADSLIQYIRNFVITLRYAEITDSESVRSRDPRRAVQNL